MRLAGLLSEVSTVRKLATADTRVAGSCEFPAGIYVDRLEDGKILSRPVLDERGLVSVHNSQEVDARTYNTYCQQSEMESPTRRTKTE
jgi:hypothetical protein